MNFQILQKVLCINNDFNYGPSHLIKGSVYTIDGFYLCPCGSHQVTLLEIQDITNMRFKCDRTRLRRQSYYNWRFIPLDDSGTEGLSAEMIRANAETIIS